MKYLKVFLFVSSAFAEQTLQAAGADKAGASDTPTYEGTAAKVDCLSAFNEARAAAGLVPFTEGAADYWSKNATVVAPIVCKAIMDETPVDNSTNFTSTVALAIQDGDKGDCAAAVTHFNGALAKFGSLPPAFNKNLEVYKSLQAISFVALYNPKDNPALDCGYFNCTKKIKKQDDDEDDDDDAAVVTNKKGLLCASSPLALITNQEPFEQKQFDKIKEAISSASAALPAFATLAAAAVALAFF